MAYRIASAEGPPHDRSFVAVAEVGGQEVGRGEGKTKKSAEQGAALQALDRPPERLMHLRSIAMKGFKSFPQRTKLRVRAGRVGGRRPQRLREVGHRNGAVLWALGEQSPLAVRGQTMKDVIFAGGHGIKGSSSAEVEVVIDNGDRVLDSDFSEISIVRKLSRDGEGEYRLNGARCRLVDIVEVLSDSGSARRCTRSSRRARSRRSSCPGRGSGAS